MRMLLPNYKHNRLRLALEIIITASVYFTLARLSLLLQFSASNATPIWPPSGFAFAMIILRGNRISPGIFIGAFAANLVVFLSNHTCTIPSALFLSAVIGVGNTAESLCGYYLLRKVIPRFEIKFFYLNVNYIFAFLGIALAMCLVSSVTGSLMIFLWHIITEAHFPMVLLTWWLGDLSGIMLLTPFLLIWINFMSKGVSIISRLPKTNREVIILFLLAVLSTGIIFDNWFFSLFIFRWAFWMIPVLVWTAIRFEQGVPVTAVMVCSIIAIAGTLKGHGPFSVDTMNESLLTLQSFISIIAITSLALNASVYKQKRTEAMLRDAGNELEIRVEERTAELAEASAQLLEQNQDLEKMNAELKSFSYIASHDLQEPLRKIQAFSTRILEKEHVNLSDAGKDYFRRMHSAAYRMQTLIEDLLAYSRTNSGEKTFEKVALHSILEDVKEDLHEMILQKSAHIQFNGLHEAKVIPFQFRQLMHNLLSNSLKFSSADRQPLITIKSEILQGVHLQEPLLQPHKKYCRIVVEDNGIGFDDGHSERIFEIFQRLHDTSKYPGTGIGLAICKKIVENHKGAIRAKSESGKGTTFYISIPAIDH
jgi:signal transduction histidine kinase